MDNGLRVVVQEDRAAPVVAVSVWYNVGSKDEPPGRTGFAHLFEHLMFTGSENAPGHYINHLAQIGATEFNGTTSFDRTNYFQTVPRGALSRALFLESDRMGHLLNAVTEERLTTQIGVVQNEKRQGDNQPFGLEYETQLEGLFPEGHPYRHSPAGLMSDLSASTLDTVRAWFRQHYGPNNAVLVLAGDIAAREARPLVEEFFGAIPPGPTHVPAPADVPTLPARVDRVLHDRVGYARISRNWVVAGRSAPDLTPLRVGAAILGGLAGSRLEDVFVRGNGLAVRVRSGVPSFQRVGIFQISLDLRPGVNAEEANRRLDQVVDEFVRVGPTDDEVRRTVMQFLTWRVQGLEQLTSKATELAEGLLYDGDPASYRRNLDALARLTADDVRAAMQRWLRRPVFALTVAPGERPSDQRASPNLPSASAPVAAADSVQISRRNRQPPEVRETVGARFPNIQRSRLSNGIEVAIARRSSAALTQVAVEFDAGQSSDRNGQEGIQALTANLLLQRTTRSNANEISRRQQELGARISVDSTRDRTSATLASLSANLGPSLALLAELIRQPAFASSDVERGRQQQLAALTSTASDPAMMATEAMNSMLFGRHPYGRSAIGSATALLAATREEIAGYYERWLRPENARIFAVSDLPSAVVLLQLEQAFGDWARPPADRGQKRIPNVTTDLQPRILLIDRPRSSQSFILAGTLLPLEGSDDTLALSVASEIIADGFLSRLNTELRERRGWAYGVHGNLVMAEHQLSYLIDAAVQTDRTGESIAAVIRQMRGFVTSRGVEGAEIERVVQNNIQQLAGRFRTSAALNTAIARLALLRRADNYWDAVTVRYRALSIDELNDVARRYFDPNRFIWVVVGDASIVRPQLEALGMPIEVADAIAHGSTHRAVR